MIIERLNENAYIAFPFLEDSILLSDGGVEIPNDLFLDARFDLKVDPASGPSIVLNTLSMSPGFVTAGLLVVYEDATPPFPFSIILPVLPDGTDNYTSSFQETAVQGVFSSGRGVNTLVAEHPFETLTFTTDPAFEPSCVTNTYNHQVDTISADEGDTLTGDVKVVEGSNISVRVISATNTLRLSARVGSGEGMPCAADPEEPSGDCGTSLFRINGLKPDWYGNFLLQGGPGIGVIPDPDNNKIVIKTSVDGCKEGCKNG